MTDEHNPLVFTALKCSLCDSTIAEFPGSFPATQSVSMALCQDLMRVCISHGYKCPQKRKVTDP